MAPEGDGRRLLLRIVEEAYDRPTWNGTNLRSTLVRVTPAVAGWRPRSGRRSIAEIVLHCAYWKYALRRRLTGERRGGFALKGTNWFEVPGRLTPQRWDECVALLDQEHRKLCEALRVTHYSPGADGALSRKVFGLAMHDAYHTGQIRLIRALCKRGGG
jgi:hypothetical protein